MRARAGRPAGRALHLQRLLGPRGGAPPETRLSPRAGPSLPSGGARRPSCRGGAGQGRARTSPARPLAQLPGCPHFLPLPACSGQPHARWQPRARPTPFLLLGCCSAKPRQDNRGHRAFVYRVSLAGKKGVPGGRDRVPAAWHPREVHNRAPYPERPQGPAVTSLPGGALGLVSI